MKLDEVNEAFRDLENEEDILESLLEFRRGLPKACRALRAKAKNRTKNAIAAALGHKRLSQKIAKLENVVRALLN